MEKKQPIKRSEVVLTARIPTNLHTEAKMKMASRRGESFQDVITSAIEDYVQSSDAVGEAGAGRSGIDPSDIIAALRSELSAKSPGSSDEKAILLLRTYTQDIREILDKIDRAFGAASTGDHAATLGNRTQKEDNDTESGPAREAGGLARAREIIADAERVNQEARRSIDNAVRPASRDRIHSSEKKHPRKKAS